MVTYTFVNGTIANADEVNQNFKDNWSELASYATTGEFNSMVQNYCASIPVAEYSIPPKMQSDWVLDSDGYFDTVTTGYGACKTSANYSGSILTGHYYSDTSSYYDEFNDDVINVSEWSVTAAGFGSVCAEGDNAAGSANTGLLNIGASPGSLSGNCSGCAGVCSLLFNINAGERLDICYCSLVGWTGAISGTVNTYACFRYGGNNIVTQSRSAGGTQTTCAKYSFCRLNSDCVDWYCNDVCQGQLTGTTTDEICTFGCYAITGYSSGDANPAGVSGIFDMLVTTSSGGSKSVYTNSKDFTNNVDWVYAEADTELDAGTCVTYDVLKASDCTVLSSGNALGSVVDISSSATSDIILKYDLCSTTAGNCACMKKYSYIVTTN